MHARSENLHDGARSAPEICDIFMNRRANSSYFHEAPYLGTKAGQQGWGGVAEQSNYPVNPVTFYALISYHAAHGWLHGCWLRLLAAW